MYSGRWCFVDQLHVSAGTLPCAVCRVIADILGDVTAAFCSVKQS